MANNPAVQFLAKSNVHPPERFDFSEPLLWPAWRKKFERYVRVSGLSESTEELQRDVFLYIVGEKAEEIIRPFASSLATLTECLNMFGKHCNPPKSIIFERVQFNKRCQKPGEPIDEFIADLHLLAETCAYGTLKEELIRDRLIVGMTDTDTSYQMQLREKLTLKEAIFIVRQVEGQNERFNYKQEIVTIANQEKIEQQSEESGSAPCGESYEQKILPAQNSTCMLSPSRDYRSKVVDVVNEGFLENSFHSSNYVQIKTEEDLEFKSEDLHHSIDLKEETAIFESQLDREYKSKASETALVCSFCDLKCTTNAVLKVHLRIHTGEKPFTCDLCDYACVRREQLKSHSKTHTGEKPFRCDLCDYSSAHKVNLNRHLRSHSGEKLFPCEICDYKCSHKANLKRHYLRTHSDEKGYTREIRNFISPRKGSLNRISIDVRAFACEICGFKFSRNGQLQSHLRTHTGEKPFICEICDFKCARKSSLKRHIIIHTGDRQFSCTICDHKFSQNSNLKNHLRTHSKQEIPCQVIS